MRGSQYEEVSLKLADEIVGAATFRNVLVFLWNRPPSPEAIGRLAPVVQRFSEANPKRGGLVVVMAKDQHLPDAATREAATTLFRALRNPLAFQIAVFETQGIMFSLLRSVLVTFGLTTGRQRTHLAGSVDDAAEWGAARAGMEMAAMRGGIVAARDAYAARLAVGRRLRDPE